VIIDFKFGVQVDHSKSQPAYDKMTLKRHGHVTWPILNF